MKPSVQRVALITGGSRGIGRAVSLKAAEAGYETIVVNYVENETEAKKTKQLIEERNSTCILVRANVGDAEEVDQLFATVVSRTNRLDAFVHCAAINAFKPTLETKRNQWDLVFNVSARSFLLCVQRCVPLMDGGRIVTLSSLGSQRAIQHYGPLGPAKAALESLVRYLAVELAPRGINVNAVSAGFVETDSLSKFPNSDLLKRAARSRTPAGRIAIPDDVADVVMFLLSPAARWIMGQVIVADGGLSLL